MALKKTYHAAGVSPAVWKTLDQECASAGDPFKLLAAAIVAQAAADADLLYRAHGHEATRKYMLRNNGRFCSVQYLKMFCNSEWLVALLSWQDDISLEAVQRRILAPLEMISDETVRQ